MNLSVTESVGSVWVFGGGTLCVEQQWDYLVPDFLRLGLLGSVLRFYTWTVVCFPPFSSRKGGSLRLSPNIVYLFLQNGTW